MPRPEKWIPLTRIEGLATLLNRGWTHQQIADYYTERLPYRVSRQLITERVREIRKDDA